MSFQAIPFSGIVERSDIHVLLNEELKGYFMGDVANQLKKYLTSLWFDASYPDSDQTKGLPQPSIEREIPDHAKLIDLTAIDGLASLCELNTFDSLVQRKSVRNYDKNYTVSIEELSYLLYCTQGVKNTKYPHKRVSPTGGAKCSIETYIYIDKVQTLSPGLYYYFPSEHKIMQIHSRSQEDFEDCLYRGNFFYTPLTFIWTAVPYRLEWKYVERAYKILLLDAGHTCQNLYTACQSIGLGTCAVGAYRQKEMDDFLGIDGENEFTVYCAPVGKKGS